MKTYNVIDLFSGIGGFSYGFKKAGFNILIGIDHDEDCMETYKNNINTDFLNADIRQISPNEIFNITQSKNIDIIIGSPPCQEYSPSNQHKKIKNSNINLGYDNFDIIPLAYHFFRLVILIHPTFFILENHPNFFKTNDYKFINLLFNLFGYKTTLNELNAEKFGIPQKRHRTFLVGNILDLDFILPNSYNLISSSISLEKTIGDLKTLEPIELNNLEVPQTIPLQNFSDYQKSMHTINRNVYNHISPFNNSKTIKTLEKLKPGEYYGKNPHHIKSHSYDVSKVITRGFNTPSCDGETMHYELPRCLTCREAARIQTFDDNFIFYGNNIPKIRLQIGNAVPPLLSKQFAENIKTLLDSI